MVREYIKNSRMAVACIIKVEGNLQKMGHYFHFTDSDIFLKEYPIKFLEAFKHNFLLDARVFYTNATYLSIELHIC